MDKKEAVALQQTRAEYVEQARTLGDRSPEGFVHTPESIFTRFSEITRIAAEYVPHTGMRDRFETTTRSPILPIAIVPGPFPQLSMRFEYSFSEPDDKREDILYQPNMFGEVIEAVSVHWIHGPLGYFGEPDKYLTDHIPPQDIYEIGEVFAVERVMSMELSTWIRFLKYNAEDENEYEILGLTSPQNSDDAQSFRSLEDRLSLVESSMLEYDKAFKQQTQI